MAAFAAALPALMKWGLGAMTVAGAPSFIGSVGRGIDDTFGVDWTGRDRRAKGMLDMYGDASTSSVLANSDSLFENLGYEHALDRMPTDFAPHMTPLSLSEQSFLEDFMVRHQQSIQQAAMPQVTDYADIAAAMGRSLR